ncbi:MAG: HAMP domain-containing sensor histidine kinase [Nitrospiraceae bacterium]|nr:HAMP domain-containing sensor histidine kinase [Nitrospiraceae bacterium]
MSLKKKIILSFLISAVVIAILAISAYVNFIEIRKEIRYLELSDTVRSKSLLIRRHEKNYFLYGDRKESEYVYVYLKDLRTTLAQSSPVYRTKSVSDLQARIEGYSRRFNRIENLKWDFETEFNHLKPQYGHFTVFFPLIESTFLERPLVNAELLERLFSLGGDARVVRDLRELDAEISALRKEGEEILAISTDLDKSAREKTEQAIRFSQLAVLVLVPTFLAVGLIALFAISQSVVRRLQLLTGAIERAGKGDFSRLSIPTDEDGEDEVSILIQAYNKMEADLIARDREISVKNEELLQSRKLASIGTLASGVAHELNNPLNNIYLAAQILTKEIGQETCSSIVKETVGDISSQTLRVKRIVNDLLEFSREKPPDLRDVNIVAVIENILGQMKTSGEISQVDCHVESPDAVEVRADKHLLEQVFINLFSNAVDAMDGKGKLTVSVADNGHSVTVRISDTGRGIVSKDMTRIFDPFFTTKEKGTGLGLAIVYSIIEKHKGKIEVKSEPFKGTAFTITLPGKYETENTDRG